MNGIVILNKEKNMSSFQAVQRLKHCLGAKKAGHCGTLDPNATGVLVVCLGTYTKLSEMFMGQEKEYMFDLLLKMTSDTYDTQGSITHHLSPEIEKNDLLKVLQTFVGGYLQEPPMYSAIKQKGKKLYELARKGITVDREKRFVNIPVLTLHEFDGKRAKIYVKCSKGTYIRSLCNDIGKILGCGAIMGNLMRLSSGNFSIDLALRLNEIQYYHEQNKDHEFMITIDSIFSDYKSYQIKEDYEHKLNNGNTLFKNELILQNNGKDDENYAIVYNTANQACGLYHILHNPEFILKPYKMLMI